MGKGKGKGKKSALREDAELEAAWRELVSWRFARGLKRISRSTLLKSKRRPGANARKAIWESKQIAKEDRRPPKPPPGPRLSLSVPSAKKLEEEVPVPPNRCLFSQTHASLHSFLFMQSSSRRGV